MHAERKGKGFNNDFPFGFSRQCPDCIHLHLSFGRICSSGICTPAASLSQTRTSSKRKVSLFVPSPKEHDARNGTNIIVEKKGGEFVRLFGIAMFVSASLPLMLSLDPHTITVPSPTCSVHVTSFVAFLHNKLSRQEKTTFLLSTACHLSTSLSY